MLKDKEVIADPQKQYELARKIHLEHHGGINKTTASIAEKYHWVRIKDTVNQVIKNCTECRDQSKQPPLRSEKSTSHSGDPSPAPKHDHPHHARNYGPQPAFPGLLPSDGSEAGAAVQPQPPGAEPLVNYEVPVDPRIMEGIQPTFTSMQTHFPDPLLALRHVSGNRQGGMQNDHVEEDGAFEIHMPSTAFSLDS